MKIILSKCGQPEKNRQGLRAGGSLQALLNNDY
jgi:hypothetical protein